MACWCVHGAEPLLPTLLVVVVLDAMGSWASPQPEDFPQFIGHGLNALEQEANPWEDRHWLQNLNPDQHLASKSVSSWVLPYYEVLMQTAHCVKRRQ